eukprot:scaffold1525_cov254-Pinguiococcus_pyrenoidosus.AAC.4
MRRVYDPRHSCVRVIAHSVEDLHVRLLGFIGSYRGQYLCVNTKMLSCNCEADSTSLTSALNLWTSLRNVASLIAAQDSAMASEPKTIFGRTCQRQHKSATLRRLEVIACTCAILLRPEEADCTCGMRDLDDRTCLRE